MNEKSEAERLPRANTSVFTPSNLWWRFRAVARKRGTVLWRAHKEALELWIKSGKAGT
jgi:hypothetical protein